MKTFNDIAREMLKISNVHDDLSPKDVPEWDSMNYLLFIAELEKEFAVTLTMDEVLGASTLGDVRKALAAKGASV